MKNHLLEKLHPNLTGGTPLNIFKMLKNLTEKVTGLLRSRVEKLKKFQTVWSNCGQTMVKLIILGILVLLNNYFSFLEFWSNLVKLWSNCGQTNYSRNISVTK